MLTNENPLIAIVDDDQLYRKIIGLVLAKHHYTVAFEAANGADCITCLQNALILPDLVIVDVEMPVMDGFETVRRIRRNWPFIKIIGHSSLFDPQVSDRMIACGADAFLLKGSETWKICQAIVKVLSDT